MSEVSRRAIIDPDNADNLVNIVESSATPGIFGLVALNADGSAISTGGGGAGDMVLADAQTVTGAKTFENGTMLLRNVADTFNGVFTNTNTADRTYTLQDANGTIAFTSDITGTNSGTNTGDQTITLTGDVTGSGTGSFATTIADEAVTFAKMQHIATNRILGRSTAGTGDIEALTGSSARDVLSLDTDDSPQFAGIELGHATDTTLSRVSAGVIAVEGVTVPTISSTNTLTNKTIDTASNTITVVEADISDYDPASTSMAIIAGATYTTIQEMQDTFHSAGSIGAIAINDVTAGNITVDAGSGYIRATDSGVAQLLFFDWGALGSTAIPSDTARYVGVEYNAGSPQVVVRTTYNWNFNTDFPLGNVVNEGGVLHIETAPHAVGDHAGFMIQRLYQTMGIKRDNKAGGLILGELGTRNISVSAGALWDRLERFSIPALDTSVAGTFDRYYDNGAGGHTKEASQTQWDNTQYDDGSGTLATLGANKYAVQWFYVELDGGYICMYGTQEHNSEAAAEAEAPPTDVPLRVSVQSTLIGRIIFKKSDATATAIESAFTTTFGGALVTDHTFLSNLAWTSSAHTGTATRIAGFDGSGAASEYQIGTDIQAYDANTAKLDVGQSWTQQQSFTDSIQVGGADAYGSGFTLSDEGGYKRIQSYGGENIIINSLGNNVGIGSTTADYTLDVSGDIGVTQSVYMTEQAAAGADTAGDGQIWVKSDTPNTLWFTDDAGTDVQLAVDLSTNVTLAGTPNYLTLSGQEITLTKLDISDDTNATGGNAITITGNSIAADAASDTAAGVQENATIAETNTGTSTTRTVTPDGLAGSYAGTKEMQIAVFEWATDTATGDGKAYFHIGSHLDGMNLVEVHAEVITAGTTGTTDIQIHNIDNALDMLSTKLTIDSGETGSDTAATAAVINTSNDHVNTNDMIRIDVDAVSTTAAKGLLVSMYFRLP